jgi:small subunit ribosomal protein S3
MALERKFVKEGIRNKDVEEFLASEFAKAGYSHCEIQRTPLSIRITVFANKPGLIIGKGGKNIESMTQILKEKFGFENPQLDVQEVINPDLDPRIVSKWIASAIERGLNYKRVANIAIEKVMAAGAAGVAIRIGGKLGSDMSRVEKFSSGYLKYSGDLTETLVKTAYAQANVKLGTIGIQVRILLEKPKELEIFNKTEKNLEAGDKIGIAEEKATETNDSS